MTVVINLDFFRTVYFASLLVDCHHTMWSFTRAFREATFLTVYDTTPHHLYQQ